VTAGEQPATSFDLAYAQGVTRPDPGPPSILAAASDRATRTQTRGIAAQVGGYALRGCILTPDEVLRDGYVVVDDAGTIDSVTRTRPVGIRVIETDGIILPGLIDLHGHPEFNIFAAWEPPTLFPNRYAWRGSDIYRQVLRTPWNRLRGANLHLDAARYAEVRALVAGTTAIQGATQQFPIEEALVRNVDRWIFGAHIGRSMVDLPETVTGQLRGVLDGIAAGDVKTFYVHLAEGRRDDARSVGEFDHLVALGALTPATVVIHGTALTRDQLGQLRDAGASLVWSPQSNLRLYAETTDIRRVLEIGIPVAIGADWLPSGSRSLLDELRVARHVMAAAGVPVTARQLVHMASRDAASIAGLGDVLGLLAPGRVADILVLERYHDNPWESVLSADPSRTELVTIGGDLCYGREEWVTTLAGAGNIADLERVAAWGKSMLLDTSYAVQPQGTPPRLAELRARLIGGYPQVGPVFG
jgi:cytosine/adenosine deaminase-related metal-dependent hydrolase